MCSTCPAKLSRPANAGQEQAHLRHLLLRDGLDALDSVQVGPPPLPPLPPPSQEEKSAVYPFVPPWMIVLLPLVVLRILPAHVPPLPPPLLDDGLLVDHGAVLQVGRVGAQEHPLEDPPPAHERGGRPGGLGRSAPIEDGRDGRFAPREFVHEEEGQGGDHGEQGGHLDLLPGGHVFFDLFDQEALGEQFVHEGGGMVVVQ